MTERISFRAAARNRPFVLTHHQVKTLSTRAGFDVRPKLLEISKSGEAFHAASLGELMRHLESRITR